MFLFCSQIKTFSNQEFFNKGLNYWLHSKIILFILNLALSFNWDPLFSFYRRVFNRIAILCDFQNIQFIPSWHVPCLNIEFFALIFKSNWEYNAWTSLETNFLNFLYLSVSEYDQILFQEHFNFLFIYSAPSFSSSHSKSFSKSSSLCSMSLTMSSSNFLNRDINAWKCLNIKIVGK